jgi:hypothetical protein
VLKYFYGGSPLLKNVTFNWFILPFGTEAACKLLSARLAQVSIPEISETFFSYDQLPVGFEGTSSLTLG